MSNPQVPGTLLDHIRSAVRAQRPYLVDGPQIEPEIKLNQNESPFDLPETLKRELLESFFAIPFNRYPKEHPYALREAIAKGIGCDSGCILIGNGSNELTYTLGLCLIGDQVPVVLPTPMFSLYTSVVRMFGGQLVQVPPRENLHFNVDALCKAVEKHQPALTVITTPNNPTGLSMPLADIERIVSIAQGFVVVDEAYVEFTEEESAYHLMDRYPNIILVRTFSKAFGLAGLRLGYLIGHPTIIGEFMKSRLPFMINRMAETVALSLLNNPHIVSERVMEMKRACKEIAAKLETLPDVDVVPSQANFLLFKTKEKPDVLLHKLADRGVLVRNMSGYPELAGYLRVNAGTPQENKAFLNALEDALYAH